MRTASLRHFLFAVYCIFNVQYCSLSFPIVPFTSPLDQFTMHTHSRKRVSQEVQERNEQRSKLNKARDKIFCRRSTAWTKDFDLQRHRAQWTRQLQDEQDGKEARAKAQEEERERLNSHIPLPMKPPLRAPFDGQNFCPDLDEPELAGRGRSPVLSRVTVFCPLWALGREHIAPWPSPAEQKYEGEGRIETDILHRRCLPPPRVEGNGMSDFKQRDIIWQSALDDRYWPIPTEEEIIARWTFIDEWEFTTLPDGVRSAITEEGEFALGTDLIKALDE